MHHHECSARIVQKSSNNSLAQTRRSIRDLEWRPVFSAQNRLHNYSYKSRQQATNCHGWRHTPRSMLCGPRRSIQDNISAIRDNLMYTNQSDLPLAICNLDLKKAFDSIGHNYLFKTLHEMGFGEYFISLIQLLYTNAESTVKVQSSLTAPLPFERISNKDVLSLDYCTRLLSNPSFTPLGSDNVLAISAYADDVTVFITSDQGYKIIDTINFTQFTAVPHLHV